MVRFLFLLFFVSILSFARAGAGNNLLADKMSNKYSVGVVASYINLASIDELYSYHLYKGGSASVGIKIGVQTPTLTHRFDLHTAMMERFPPNLVLSEKVVGDDDRNRFLNDFIIEGVYTLFFPIFNKEASMIRVRAKVDWVNTLHLVVNHYGTPEILLSGLAPGLRAETTSNKHHFYGEFSVPVIAWTVRSHYSLSMAQNYEKFDVMMYIKQNSQLQSVHNLWSVNAQLGYSYAFSSRFRFDASYRYRYMHNASPRRLVSSRGIYSMGLNYYF